MRTRRLQTHFKLSAQHPRFAATGIDHKRLAGMGDVEKRHPATQFDMAFTAAEIHRNGTVGIQRDPGLIGQGNGAYLPRRTDVIGAQIIEPAHGLPARKYANHQQQARRNGQPAGPVPHCAAPRNLHRRQVTLQRQRLFVRQGTARHFAQLPYHLRPGVGFSVGGIGLQPTAEGGLVTAVGLIVQHGEPRQRSAFLFVSDRDNRTIDHGAVPAGGSRKLALQASRARIMCFSTALCDTPMTLAMSA